MLRPEHLLLASMMQLGPNSLEAEAVCRSMPGILRHCCEGKNWKTGVALFVQQSVLEGGSLSMLLDSLHGCAFRKSGKAALKSMRHGYECA